MCINPMPHELSQPKLSFLCYPLDKSIEKTGCLRMFLAICIVHYQLVVDPLHYQLYYLLLGANFQLVVVHCGTSVVPITLRVWEHKKKSSAVALLSMEVISMSVG